MITALYKSTYLPMIVEIDVYALALRTSVVVHARKEEG